ncbi:MAG: CoA ester lyase [Chloroflexi bacterium]|nr:CoA ester lyase [Chloroflexota bacterium]
MRARRALLYMPGNDWRKIEKAAGLNVDCVCLDLEDAVAPERKDEARAMVVRALSELDFGRSERLVRINAPESGLAEADLDAVLAAKPDGIVVPKVGSPEGLAALNIPAGMTLIAQIESALGLVNGKEIAAVVGLEALIFGAEDYAADLGAVRSIEADEVFVARSIVVAHAAAYGLQAIDMLWVDFKDAAGLTRLAQQGARLGYSGMQIIHPDQIEPVQRSFTPSKDEVAAARRVVEAYEASLQAGKGAFALDGKMVDMPVVKAAQRVLARTQAE